MKSRCLLHRQALLPTLVLALSPLAPALAQNLLISGVIDGPLSGGIPKAIEVYAVTDIADLSAYGLGSANNGGGSDGQEFTFPAVAVTAGSYLYIATEENGFGSFFGFAPDFTSSAASINGDDAIELFRNGAVVDVFGDINLDGTGEPWDYQDGWAYRNADSGPDGDTFVLGNWRFSSPNALDGETSNASAELPFPLGTYGGEIVDRPPVVVETTPDDGATGVATTSDVVVQFSEPVTVSNPWFSFDCTTSGDVDTDIIGDGLSFTLMPRDELAGGESCTVTVLASQVSDQDGTPDPLAGDFPFSFTTAAGCGGPATLISAIQGNGATSPLEGASVTIEGVVVGDFQTTGINGFFVQEELVDQDQDIATSEGLFVFEGGSTIPVNLGDIVRVTGVVDEFFGLTELTSISNITHCGSGASVPAAAIALPFPPAEGGVPYLERFENMLVTTASPLTVTENFNHGRFGQLTLANGRLFQPTHVAAPGAPAQAVAEANALNRIIIDDGDTSQNPDPIPNPDDSFLLSAADTVRNGSTVLNDGLAVLNYAFDEYRLQPVSPFTLGDDNPRSPAPDSTGIGQLRVAAFNVLNYFTTIDTGAEICGPAALGCRGADSASELARQRAKIVSALGAMDADIVGLVELENNAVAAIQDLVDGINAVAGPGTYDFVDTGTIGTDAIKVGFIYKPATVSAVGEFAILDATVDSRFIDTKNRPALIQTFAEAASGERFTVAVNHFKSKGSPCDDVGDPDVGDGQGNCNLTRTNAALALVDYLATDPTDSNDPDVLIIGDLNAYAMEDPITVIRDAGFVELINEFLGMDAYSYVFFEQFGYLDHALASESLRGQITGVTEWHINADEPRIIDYNEEFKSPGQVQSLYSSDPYRASDHDPVIVGMNLNAPPICTHARARPARLYLPNRRLRRIRIRGVTDPGGQPVTIRIDSIRQDEPVVAPGGGAGATAPDGDGIGSSRARVRAERERGGNGRFYHIGFTATNAGGGSCSGEVQVAVPRRQGWRWIAVDDGPLYDSTATTESAD